MTCMDRPYILVNVAMSVDGKIDLATRKGATISSIADKTRVDQLRASVDAIIVGGRTLLGEDPKLTIDSPGLRAERKAAGLPENPAKVAVVSVADLKEAGDFLSAGPAPRLVYTTSRTTPEKVALLENAGAQVFVLGDQKVDVASMIESLHQLGFRKILLEGGGTLIAEFFRLGLVDEMTIYIAPRIFGGASAPTLADGPGLLLDDVPQLRLTGLDRFDREGGILLHYVVVGMH